MVFGNVLSQIDVIIPSPPISNQQPVTLSEIIDIITFIANFFVVIGPIFAVIAIIIYGIMYMKSGDDAEKVKKAHSYLKWGLFGALIILGVGVLINTVAAIVTREFFCNFSLGGICVFGGP